MKLIPGSFSPVIQPDGWFRCSWSLPFLLCPRGSMLGWEVFSWGEREEARHLRRGDWGWGWGLLRCSLSNSFHSGLGMSSWRSGGHTAWTSQLLLSALPSNTHSAVTPVAQPSFYRFQSPNISYGPGKPEPESDLSRPGTELAPDTTRGLAGNKRPQILH